MQLVSVILSTFLSGLEGKVKGENKCRNNISGIIISAESMLPLGERKGAIYLPNVAVVSGYPIQVKHTTNRSTPRIELIGDCWA